MEVPSTENRQGHEGERHKAPKQEQIAPPPPPTTWRHGIPSKSPKTACKKSRSHPAHAMRTFKTLRIKTGARWTARERNHRPNNTFGRILTEQVRQKFKFQTHLAIGARRKSHQRVPTTSRWSNPGTGIRARACAGHARPISMQNETSRSTLN